MQQDESTSNNDVMWIQCRLLELVYTHATLNFSSEVLVSEPGMSMPYGVAVDAEANQVYWTDGKAGNIQRLTLMCQSGIQEHCGSAC